MCVLVFLVAAMIAITCTPWSMARNRTNTLRSKLEPWGLLKPRKPYSLKDNQRLVEGNLPARRLLALLKVLIKSGVPWAIENPATSNLWNLPFLVKLAKSSAVQAIVIDQCAFGRPWRKTTKLMFGKCLHDDISSLAQFVCTGRKVCSHSKLPHVQLTGSNQQGVAMTAVAQEFPTRMSSKLSHILLHKQILKRSLRASD